ncbi:MAG: toprim domain-containing protein [Dysgonamonadaceae bacterium]|nr:toprim domain-containing protein [Dysgonamonadaceae bacterium]
MDYTTINKFPIKDYLVQMGIHPAKDKGYYGMYHSPFREDKDASLKVDYNKNLWIDFGSNEGGTLIDLVMRMENCSNGEAMRLLEQKLSGTVSFSFHGNNIPNVEKEQKSGMQITKVTELTTPVLLDFLNKRSITTELAKRYCKEIHYSVNEKPYYAIGFQNDTGGWVLRNSLFKGCTSMDATTLFRNGNNKETCLLFEGFADFISYLVLKKENTPKHNTIVLNSVVNLPKVKNELSGYRMIYAFLDNDERGRAAVQELRKLCKDVRDMSEHYAKHKDLNDYLCSRSTPKQVVKKKPGRGLKM